MVSRVAVDEFVGQKVLAFAGLSRSGKKFSNTAFRELKGKGYRLLSVNPGAEIIDGERCYANLAELPERVGGALVMVPPAESEKVVREAAAAGITRVWLQQGAESPEALRACEELGITAIHGECILMFAEPVGAVHKLHRFIWRLLGKLPK